MLEGPAGGTPPTPPDPRPDRRPVPVRVRAGAGDRGPLAGRVLGELAIDAARIGTYVWEVRTGLVTWDERLLELYGEPPGSSGRRTIDDFHARLHPDDRPRVAAELDRAVHRIGELHAEYRVVRPDGEVRWHAARGRVLHDADGRPARLLGAVSDVTERQRSEARTARILESMPTAFFSLDREWRFRYVNAEAERVLSESRDRLLDRVVWELFPAAVGTEFEHRYRTAMATGRPVAFDAYYPPPLDAWFEVRAWPGPDGLAVYFVDITARRRAQERTEAAGRRAALVARVTAELTENLDEERAVGRLAELVVPALADWSLVTLAAEDRRTDARRGLRDIGWAHVDPALRPVLQRYSELRLEALTDRAPLVRALGTGEAVVLDSGATEVLAGVLDLEEARVLVRRLAPETLAIIPLRGRAGIVGVLSLFGGPERAPLTPDEVDVAREVAGRAGLALDNARLYRQQRRLAEGLQRALLTDPPQTDGLEIAVRYVPAAEAAQVGGDWYDAFVQRDGATVLVIGDVVGHDIVAAASMGQLRSVLRGVAVSTGAGPADLLAAVDRAMLTLDAGTLATAIVARVAQAADDVLPGDDAGTDPGHDPGAHVGRGARPVRWSNAGHPPPLLVRADRTVTVLDAGHPDLLLGIIPETVRSERSVVLHPGDTLLLYTDGLVERRDLPLEAGIARLRDTVADLADRGPDGLCDAVLERLLTARRHDDVAVVAVRVRPVADPAAPAG